MVDLNAYRSASIAVTGGTGFIGTRLVERLAFDLGAKTRVAVRNWPSAAWVSRTEADLIPADVNRPETLEQLFDGVEIVFHCVGVGGSPEDCQRVNVQGTENVVRAASAAGVKRIVYLSTVGVHGPTLSSGLNEDSDFRLTGHPYADSKVHAEKSFWQLTQELNISATCVRPTYVWGPNSRMFTVEPIERMVKDQFYLVAQGEGKCNAVYVDNVVDLCLVCGIHPAAHGEAFLVRDKETQTWREFFSHYQNMIGCQKPFKSIAAGFRPGRPINAFLRPHLFEIQDKLYRRALRMDKRSRVASLLFFRVPCKSLHLTRELLDRLAPNPYGAWDRKKFCSPGHIDIAKAESCLGFRPPHSVVDGMLATKNWLVSQAMLDE